MRLALHLHVAGVFSGIIAIQRDRRGRLSCNQYRLRDQLRRRAIGIKISEDAVHTRLGQLQIVVKDAVFFEDGMIVNEKLEVLADDEQVIKFLVDDFEITHQ